MSVASALKYIRPFLAGLVALGLAAGFAAKPAGLGAWSPVIWAAVTLPVLLALLAEIVTSLRRGDLGLDIVAALSMTAALVVGENLAAAIVALMYAGGQYLESYAERAARREMTALLSRVPRTAMRHRDGRLRGGRARPRRCPATGCWSGGATWCRWTARSPTGWRCSTSRR